MRAVVVRAPGGPEAPVLEEVPPPEPRPGEARIRVEACGVCFHDVVTRDGTVRRGVRMPLIPGHEVSGVVEAVGPAARGGFRPGDRVCTAQRRHVCGHCRQCRSGRETSCAEQEFLGDVGLNGGYAELVCVGEENVARVPEGVPLDAAAIAACSIGTELNAVRDAAGVRVGERVLVTGAGGGIGIHGVQLARLSGIRAAGAEHVVLALRGGDFSAAVRAAMGACKSVGAGRQAANPVGSRPAGARGAGPVPKLVWRVKLVAELEPGVTLLHGSAVWTHWARPSSGLMRCGRTPGVRGRACGSAHWRRWPPRSPAARPSGSAARPR